MIAAVLLLFVGEAKQPPMWLAGETNWGTVEQVGRVIHFRGHPIWEATGCVRADGKLLLTWMHRDGSKALSLYTIKGKVVVGQWGWEGVCRITRNGDIDGQLWPDRIRLVEKE